MTAIKAEAARSLDGGGAFDTTLLQTERGYVRSEGGAIVFPRQEGDDDKSFIVLAEDHLHQTVEEKRVFVLLVRAADLHYGVLYAYVR